MIEIKAGGNLNILQTIVLLCLKLFTFYVSGILDGHLHRSDDILRIIKGSKSFNSSSGRETSSERCLDSERGVEPIELR